MGGQDGYQRDMVSQNTDSKTIVGGFRLTPSKKFNIGLNIAQTNSDQKMDPFDLSAPDYVETHPPMSYDFSQSHLYSMIDLDRIDFNADANFKFTNDFWMNVYFRRSEYEDNVALFDDLDGSISVLGAYLGWSF